MLKSHLKFNSKDGKRLILIVDDEKVTRDLLGKITENDFEAIYAKDGEEALEKIRENADILSLILLDLKLPKMDGREVLKTIRSHEEWMFIPVIVLTSEEKAEVECLELGSSDFILKPFRMPESIIARIQRTIELFEDRYIIQSTERDEVTGLFTRDFFMKYCEQFDLYHPDLDMDAIFLDINHFHLVNELYGRETGDEVLLHLADFLKELRETTNCTVSRIEGDKFLMYMPHGSVDYETVSREINSHFDAFQDAFIRVRAGIYMNADKDIEIERRFDRAARAANTIRGDYSRFIAFYDSSLHEKKIFEERLLNDVDEALKDGQFYLNYQPKYNVENDDPVLVSAEALVRWNHPALGTISPGVFIPLLEKNGLIQKLDFHIWEKAMEMAARIRDDFGKKIPISINVSRMDLYIHDLIRYLKTTMKKYDLDSDYIYLEITESAYAEDQNQITETIEKLSGEGFTIEMDDFGTGYSSLNMLADLDVDVIKLDMRFVQNIKSNEKQEKMVKLVLDIARDLSMKVVAEGVEEKEQVEFLKAAGCDVIQGFYFSKPLSEDDFIDLVKKA